MAHGATQGDEYISRACCDRAIAIAIALCLVYRPTRVDPPRTTPLFLHTPYSLLNYACTALSQAKALTTHFSVASLTNTCRHWNLGCCVEVYMRGLWLLLSPYGCTSEEAISGIPRLSTCHTNGSPTVCPRSNNQFSRQINRPNGTHLWAQVQYTATANEGYSAHKRGKSNQAGTQFSCLSEPQSLQGNQNSEELGQCLSLLQ